MRFLPSKDQHPRIGVTAHPVDRCCRVLNRRKVGCDSPRIASREKEIGGTMSRGAFSAVVEHAKADGEFRQEFMADPFHLLSDFHLTPQEVRDLIYWLPRWLSAFLDNAPDIQEPYPSDIVAYDRRDAGRQLAQRLMHLRDAHPYVLAIPRGGVVVGHEVAQALGAPLSVVIARKLLAPGNVEFSIGAVAPGNERVLDQRAISLLAMSEIELEEITTAAQGEIESRISRYPGLQVPADLGEHDVILVDDGLATGATAIAAAQAIRSYKPRRCVLATPICPRRTVDAVRSEVDELVCLATPSKVRPVGMWYESFEPTLDEEVVAILQETSTRLA